MLQYDLRDQKYDSMELQHSSQILIEVSRDDILMTSNITLSSGYERSTVHNLQTRVNNKPSKRRANMTHRKKRYA